ncbi:MAG TPA: TlpA disulfide reductase family protein [Azospira sp.]|nr:TlpA disulfide reductase family protein [Azospira sp.]
MFLPRSLFSRLALAALLAATAFAAGLYFGQTASPPLPREAPPAAVAQLLQLQLPDMEGHPQALSQWQGKVRVINFWATWCPPCREEMPEFSRLQTDLGPQGVQFVGIAVDGADSVRDFSRQTPVSYPLLLATPEAVANLKALGNSLGGLPFTLVVDRQGRARHIRLGGLDGNELAAIIKGLL